VRSRNEIRKGCVKGSGGEGEGEGEESVGSFREKKEKMKKMKKIRKKTIFFSEKKEKVS